MSLFYTVLSLGSLREFFCGPYFWLWHMGWTNFDSGYTDAK